MTETIIVNIGHHYLGFTISGPAPPVFIPRNLKFQLKEEISIQVKSPNNYGHVPYATDFVLVRKSPQYPNPFICLETSHNFLFGQNQLLFAPRDGPFGWTNWEACDRESVIRNPFNQPLPVVHEWNAGGVNAWNAGGAWAASSASSSVRAFTASSALSSLRAFMAFSASSGMRGFTASASSSRQPTLLAFAASLNAHGSLSSPLPISKDENDEDNESNEDVEDEDDEYHDRVFTVDDDDHHIGH